MRARLAPLSAESSQGVARLACSCISGVKQGRWTPRWRRRLFASGDATGDTPHSRERLPGGLEPPEHSARLPRLGENVQSPAWELGSCSTKARLRRLATSGAPMRGGARSRSPLGPSDRARKRGVAAAAHCEANTLPLSYTPRVGLETQGFEPWTFCNIVCWSGAASRHAHPRWGSNPRPQD